MYNPAGYDISTYKLKSSPAWRPFICSFLRCLAADNGAINKILNVYIICSLCQKEFLLFLPGIGAV